MNTVFAAIIYAAGGIVAIEPTPLDAVACEELKEEIMQSTDAVCIDLNGILELHENGFYLSRFEPSLEGEL